jgi:hypothetical protein
LLFNLYSAKTRDMNINLLRLRDDTRDYLANHPKPQTVLAKECGVPHSWLNKFCNGAFPNIRLERFQSLIDWVSADRSANQPDIESDGNDSQAAKR